MKKIKRLFAFIRNGKKVYYQASRGVYECKSDAVREIEKDMFSRKSNIGADKMNLYSDRKKIERDIRKSFDNIARIKENKNL